MEKIRKRILAIVFANKFRLILIIFFSCSIGITYNYLIPQAFAKIINSLYISKNNFWITIIPLAMKFVILYIFLEFFYFGNAFFTSSTFPMLKIKIRNDILDICNFKSDFSSGVEFQNQLYLLSDSITNVISEFSYAVCPNLISFTFILVKIYQQSFKVAIAMFIWLIFYFIILYFAGQIASNKIKQMSQKKSEAAEYIVDNLKNFSILKFFNIKDFRNKKLFSIQKDEYEGEKKSVFTSNITGVILGFLVLVFSSIGINYLIIRDWYGGIIDATGAVTAMNVNAGVTHMSWYFYKVFPTIVNNLGQFKQAEKTIEPYLKDKKIELYEKHVKYENFNIEFNNVTVLFNEEKFVENLHFTIPFGSKVAIVGRSGIGKSTILKVLAGLYEDFSGEILIGGKKLCEDSINIITYISQNFYLFNVSIRENILYGDINASDEKLMEIAKQNEVLEFAEFRNNNLDFIVGDNGNLLSGGQKQRICIARGMMKLGAKILLCDEPFSSLDKILSDKILQMILDRSKDKTVICVDHSGRFVNYSEFVLLVDKNGANFSTKDEFLKNHKIENVISENNDIFE